MSNHNQTLNFIYLLGVLLVVASAFAARRAPLRQSVRMALVWLLLFGAAFVVVALKDDFADLARHVMASGRGVPVETGRILRIPKADDGHFWVTAELNGTPIRFLVDSGATVTSISADSARDAGIEPDSEFPAIVETANGTVAVQPATAKRLAVGSIVRTDFTVHIYAGEGPNVLGMNFLSTLSGWSVEGRWLVLRP